MSGQYRVLLTGGGTGGHVYPCISIFTYLNEHGLISESLYLGVQGRAEDQIVPRAGISLAHITSAPLASGSLFFRLQGMLSLIRGTIQSLRQIIRFKPDLVIATGGYVSAPVLLAAYLAKFFRTIKIVVEEQNLVPGLLNKVGSLLADVVLVTFKESVYFTWGKKAVNVGYPLREQYYTDRPDKASLRASLDIPIDKFVVLITGGSLGARSINRVVAESMPELASLEQLHIIHSIGMSETDEYHALAETCSLLEASMGARFDRDHLTATNDQGQIFYQAFPFIHRMFEYQIAADLIISRAGAGALAEIAAVGVASIIIPKRGLPGDHQELNAINMADRGCCSIIFEKRDRQSQRDCVPTGEFLELLRAMVTDRAKSQELAHNIQKMHARDAHHKIVDTIQKVLAGEAVNYIDEIIEPRFVKFQRQFDHLVAYLDQVRQDRDFDNPYLRYYSLKISDYLQSSDFLVVNKGIKLIGPLQREDLYEYLRDNFRNFKGFLRRNSLISLRKADFFSPIMRQLIDWGLADSYYEVRREAIALVYRFVEEYHNDPAMKTAVRGILKNTFESFEVKVEAIKLAVVLFEEGLFFELVQPFQGSRNIRLREALLESIIIGLVRQRLSRDERLKIFLKNTLITTSEFKPEFKIRENYLSVLKELEGVPNGNARH
ncbi:UDP-N-acetylglucosamine--N-acetylmuramyl-(pentapeptide) pyrophosphoryl-undecaprenol N-acetylglucosamine transferase [bacterium]|nr:UDP-N-acetylglucosamine--N-acetylmuramyl-(pentapeptide) pyrophosphoryl-undecaprenol N-acetylglucosamine transferase [bacterium]